MKFENIKVGDEIFIVESVRYGWNSSESFFIPKEVVKVTKTQFVIDGNLRFNKKNGWGHGNNNAAHLKDDKDRYTSNIVCDESEKLLNFKRKLNLESVIQDRISKLKLSYNSKLNIDELSNLKTKIIEISEILN